MQKLQMRYGKPAARHDEMVSYDLVNIRLWLKLPPPRTRHNNYFVIIDSNQLVIMLVRHTITAHL